MTFFLFTSCASSTENSTSYITKQQAIDAALEVASSSQPEVSGAQEQPSNIRAEQMTLNEAVKKISKDNQPAAGYDPNMMVWFVTMEGLWLEEMPAPGVAVTPAPYHHYAIIIDAKTRSEIESSLTP